MCASYFCVEISEWILFMQEMHANSWNWNNLSSQTECYVISKLYTWRSASETLERSKTLTKRDAVGSHLAPTHPHGARQLRVFRTHASLPSESRMELACLVLKGILPRFSSGFTHQEFSVCCWNFGGLPYLAFYKFIQLATVLVREALTKMASKK